MISLPTEHPLSAKKPRISEKAKELLDALLCELSSQEIGATLCVREFALTDDEDREVMYAISNMGVNGWRIVQAVSKLNPVEDGIEPVLKAATVH